MAFTGGISTNATDTGKAAMAATQGLDEMTRCADNCNVVTEYVVEYLLKIGILEYV